MTVTISGSTGLAGVDGSAGTPALQGTDTNTGVYFPGADRIGFAEGGTQVGEFDASGNFKFNSGYGSVATAYGCRAWVLFSVSGGTPSITTSANVSSITDVNVGDFGINFTNAMPDANYVFCPQPGGVTRTSNFFSSQYTSKVAGSFTVSYVNSSFSSADPTNPVGVAVFR